MLAGIILDALASCHTADGINIKSLVGNNASSGLNLLSFQLSAKYHEDIAILALMTYPFFVLIVSNWCETDVHVQLGGLEQEFFHDLSAVQFVHSDENA